MIENKNIDWYLEVPSRLKNKKPFTRGGDIVASRKADVSITTKAEAKFSDLKLQEISQDIYLQEYDPSLHRIKFNKSIPHIAVQVGSEQIEIDDMTMTAAYQKDIHAAHVLHLTANPLDFVLCNSKPKKTLKNNEPDDEQYDINDLFQELKQEWLLRDMESKKYDVISKQKKVGDVALLYSYDRKKKKFSTKVYSYDDGYLLIPNYNEYGEQIACSLYYRTDDSKEIIDTYDDTYHYRLYYDPESEYKDEDGWIREKELHGFSRCPLLYKRGKVAWEYAESAIEMWELMANINSVALKRFGTFGLVLTGEMSPDSFKRDASTLIINLSSDTSNGKQDAKTIEFPEPQKMLEYLDFLETKISIFSSVSFITPKDITSTGSGGNGIFLAMKNDLALATQSVSDWSPFTNDMVYLFQEGLSLEAEGTNKFNNLKISAKLKPWSMESETTKITNLKMQSTWLSKESILAKSPDAAPDEMERVEKEAMQAQEIADKQAEKEAQKALNIAQNNSNQIIDNTAKMDTTGQS